MIDNGVQLSYTCRLQKPAITNLAPSISKTANNLIVRKGPYIQKTGNSRLDRIREGSPKDQEPVEIIQFENQVIMRWRRRTSDPVVVYQERGCRSWYKHG